MGEVLVSLAPFYLASMLTPLTIIVVVLLLKEPQRGLARALALLGGMTTMRLLQGLVFGLTFNRYESTHQTPQEQSALLLGIFTFAGILLLVSAARKFFKAEDLDAPPPKWLSGLEKVTPGRLYLIGLGLLLINMKMWVFTLGALGVIAEKEVGQPASTWVYLIYIVLAQALLLAPILIRVLLPRRSVAIMGGLGRWLEQNESTLTMAVKLIFGLFFLYKGLSGLLA